MYGTVIFCKDGILRFRSGTAEQVAVPLVMIQQVTERDNYPFFMEYMRHPVTLESGSTIGSFLLCLEPWAEVASSLTDRQVDAYIAELRKPSSEESTFDRCEIRKHVSFYQEMHHDPIPEGVGIMEWFNRDRGAPVWLDRYQINADYGISGYKNGDNANYSMSTSIHKLKNVPLVINRYPVITCTNGAREDGPKAILDPNAPGMMLAQYEGDGPVTGGYFYAKGSYDEEMTVDALIRVVVEDGLWFDTPRGAASLESVLQDRLADLDLDAGEEAEPDDFDEAEEQEEKKLTVKIAPGAFDGVIEQTAREATEWELLLEKVSALANLSSYPHRIGRIDEDKPSDQRISGLMLE